MKVKVNFHLCEACNYHCRHCFAKFGSARMLSTSEWKQIADNIVASHIVSDVNLAGGEPLLHPGTIEIAKYLQEKGVQVSLVTNGSLMTEDWIRESSNLFSMIGFSVDALNPSLQQEIGRCSNTDNTVMKAKDYAKRIKLIRKYSPNTKIKVNTVVSSLNQNDCIAEQILEWNIDRWKILKMQDFRNQHFSNTKISITEQEFETYVKRSFEILGLAYQKDKVLYDYKNNQIVVENSLRGDYILIGAGGYLLDNTKGMNYERICNCLTGDFEKGVACLAFNYAMYSERY